MEDNTRGILIALAVAVCLGVGAGVYMHNSKKAEPDLTPAPAAVQAPAPSNDGAAASLAELEGSDSSVRDKAKGLSANPKFAEWLKTENLVRRMTAGIAIVADGNSPRDSFEFLGPKKRFTVKRKGKKVFVDPKSYSRYDTFAGVVDSIDADAFARLFGDLQPLIRAAYAELGSPNRDFKATFVRAIQDLLKTPIVSGDIELRQKVTSYAMKDQKLEGLSAAQKHLLRMGPNNAAKIQLKLRQIAHAMNVPDDQLPPAENYTASAK